MIKKDFTSVMKYIYIIILLAMVFLVVVNITNVSKKEADLGLNSYEDISNLWLDKNGQPIDFSEPELHEDENGDIWLYCQLVEATKQTNTLVFRSKNTYVTLYANDELLYETDIIKAPFSNKSPGTRWNIIELEPEQQGLLSLKISDAYQDGKCKVDYFYFGDGVAIVLKLIEEKLLSIIVSILLFVLGCAYIISDIVVSHKKANKEFGLGYLGAFTVLCAIWALLETNVFQLFGNNLQILQVVDNMTIVAAIAPLFMYLGSTFQMFEYKVLRYFCAIDMMYILFAIAMQIFGGPDFHQTLTGSAVGYGVAISVLVFSAFFAKRKKSHPKQRLEVICEKIGVIVIFAGMTLDFSRYLMVDVMDRAFFTRFGLLIGTAFLGIGGIHRIMYLIKQGDRAEIISKLAYEDGLTELANRTAYLEKITLLAETRPDKKLAIIYFDINNLKVINDSLGHQAGDMLIKGAVSILQKVFGASTSLYRIGGDEFVGLLLSAQPQIDYNRLKVKFYDEVNSFNQSGELSFEIAIAMGVAYCDEVTKETIEKAEKEADQKMYENKSEMKQFALKGSALLSTDRI